MERELTDQEVQRRRKLEVLRTSGIEPYQSRFDRTHSTAQAIALFTETEKSASGTEPASGAHLQTEPVAIAGRLTASRVMGKAAFADVRDGEGRIQLRATVDALGDEGYRRFTELDLGDWIGVRGPIFRTRRGEITVDAQEFILLAKALRPLPEKWHGLKDVELRYRQRYLDLISNPEVKQVFLTRSRVIDETRAFLRRRCFIEVETPVLQVIPGGGMARPFRTHHNALDSDLYLRIALELHLKRLIVGGFERVYEIGRVFRNEGIDRIHNPEYTMLELYQAYTDWEGMLELTESLLAHLVEQVVGGSRFTYQGQEIDCSRPFKRLDLVDAASKAAGADLLHMDEAAVRKLIEQRHITPKPGLGWGGLVNELFEELVQDSLVQPTFVLGHPSEISPLARMRADDPRLTDRFELLVAGQEIANAFSELNDPLDQRARFEQQARARAAGAEETHPMDEDFLTALEYGFPPTGGMGMGIDRVVALLTDQPSLRDVILFPTLRAQHAEP